MTDDKNLRHQLRHLLTGEHAHMAFDAAVADIEAGMYGMRYHGIAHTLWQLLEHLRIAQWDILEFSRNKKHVSPKWPDGYWPTKDAPPRPQSWHKSVAMFKADLEDFIALIEDGKNDLFAPFPWGDGQTLFREALVLARHNSYHLGQLVQLKKALRN